MRCAPHPVHDARPQACGETEVHGAPAPLDCDHATEHLVE